MKGEYPDAEIDKLLETFDMNGMLSKNMLNGEFIDNDIRLSDAIRDTIDEIKLMERSDLTKTGCPTKKAFLMRYIEVAE